MIFLTLTGKTMAENRRLWEENRTFADGAELRADFLSPKERSEVSFFPKEAGVPVILTCRKPEDGGCWTDGEEARRGFFLSQRESGFSFFDFEENFEADFVLHFFYFEIEQNYFEHLLADFVNLQEYVAEYVELVDELLVGLLLK